MVAYSMMLCLGMKLLGSSQCQIVLSLSMVCQDLLLFFDFVEDVLESLFFRKSLQLKVSLILQSYRRPCVFCLYSSKTMCVIVKNLDSSDVALAIITGKTFCRVGVFMSKLYYCWCPGPLKVSDFHGHLKSEDTTRHSVFSKKNLVCYHIFVILRKAFATPKWMFLYTWKKRNCLSLTGPGAFTGYGSAVWTISIAQYLTKVGHVIIEVWSRVLQLYFAELGPCEGNDLRNLMIALSCYSARELPIEKVARRSILRDSEVLSDPGEYDIGYEDGTLFGFIQAVSIWEVIQNGNGLVSITTDTQGQIKVLPPRTAEEIVARERERKARTTLLMALPEDHLAKFHRDDARDEGLSQVYGQVPRASKSVRNSWSSTNEVSTTYSVPNPSGHNSKYEQTSSYSLLANQSSCPQLDHKDLEQIDEYNLEEMDLRLRLRYRVDAEACEIKGIFQGLKKVECTYSCYQQSNFGNAVSTMGDTGKMLLSPEQFWMFQAQWMGDRPTLLNFKTFNGGPVVLEVVKVYITGKGTCRGQEKEADEEVKLSGMIEIQLSAVQTTKPQSYTEVLELMLFVRLWFKAKAKLTIRSSITLFICLFPVHMTQEDFISSEYEAVVDAIAKIENPEEGMLRSRSDVDGRISIVTPKFLPIEESSFDSLESTQIVTMHWSKFFDRKSTIGWLSMSLAGDSFLGNTKSRPFTVVLGTTYLRGWLLMKDIQVLKIHTDDNVADLLTKAFDVSRGLIGFRESLRRVIDGTEALLLPTLFILWLDTVSTDSAKLVPLGKVCTAIETLKKNTAKALISLLTTITLSTTMAVLDSCPKHNMVAYLEKTEGNAEFHEIIDFLTRSSIHHALTVSPVVSTTFVEQFWTSAKSKIINNVRHITAKVAGKPVSISEASIRSDLLFDDANGIDSLPNQAIFDAIQLMGYEGDLTVLTFNKALFSPQWRFLFHTMNHCISSKSTSWDQIPTNIATAVICLTSNQKYNFSKLIFDGMLRHLDAKKKFVMYPRFISIFLDKQLANVPVPLDHFPVNALTSKVFSFMVKKGKHFSGKVTPLFASIPSPSTTIEPQTDPSPRLSPSTTIHDSIPESSGGNLGGFRSSQGNSKIEGTNQEAQEASQTCHHTPQSMDEECLLTGRKSAKGKPTVHKDPLFDEIPEDSLDYMETEDAQDEGRTRDVVDEEKENAEDALSTEDVLSTAQQKKDSTDKQNKGTDDQIEGTDEQSKGTDDHTKEGSATQTSQPPTSTIFGDDETIAQVLLNISQAKAVSREKEKGVKFKDIVETKRPKPTLTRSLLTLNPLPKIDPKDKGKKKIEEEDESESESDGIPKAENKFKQLASDEEMARKVQEEWEREEERNRLAEEEASNDALIRNYDDIKARIEADRLLAEKLQE
ncbi:hypothetical protein Tco_0332447 [Tanacetum coccineum]